MQTKLVFHVGQGKRAVASLDRTRLQAQDRNDFKLLSVTAIYKVVE